MAISNGEIEQLLKRCSLFPWTLTMDDKGSWALVGPNGGKVAPELPAPMSNYDRRLMAIAPELAIEVLRLRRS